MILHYANSALPNLFDYLGIGDMDKCLKSVQAHSRGLGLSSTTL